ncbi:MAG TPA: APC family permease [Terracidiphilus sp.]|jgi:amino acid transporter
MATAESSPGANHNLKRQLGLRDLVLTQILCVVGSSWVGVAGGLGRAQTLTWIAAMLLFYLPMAASVIELNRKMPLEGGLYVWAHEAFGDLGGFLTAWNIGVYGIAVTATILYAIPTEISYFLGPRAAWLPENKMASLGIVTLAIAGITIAALRGLEWGKWIHNIGGASMLIVFGALIVLPTWALIRHVPVHWTPFSFALPPANMRTFALFGQMMFGGLCGLEYIAILAGESRQPAESIGKSVWIASPIICAMFILGTGSVVALVPQGKIDFIAPIPQTLRIGLGNTGWGNVVAMTAIVLVELRLLGAASFIFTGATRLPMTAGWDHLVPEWFTRMHPRWRTPSNSILFASGVVLLFVVMASLGVHAQEAFQLLTNASETHYEIAYLAMFAIPLAGSAVLRKALPRWLKWTSVAGFSGTCFSLLISAYPFVTVVNARAYAAKILGTILISNVVAICFYKLRTRAAVKRKEKVADTATIAPAGDAL